MAKAAALNLLLTPTEFNAEDTREQITPHSDDHLGNVEETVSFLTQTNSGSRRDCEICFYGYYCEMLRSIFIQITHAKKVYTCSPMYIIAFHFFLNTNWGTQYLYHFDRNQEHDRSVTNTLKENVCCELDSASGRV